MARVQSCCCGCSLRTGSLIILWLNVVCSTWMTITYLSSNVSSFWLGVIVVLPLAATIMALYGTYERKPSFMLPHIVLNVFCIVLCVVALFLMIVATTFFTGMINSVTKSTQQSASLYDSFNFDRRGSNDYFSSNVRDNLGVGVVETVTTTLVILVATLILVNLAILYYFTVVVYSYYRQLVEGTEPRGGVIYSAPVNQGMMGGGGYPQPQHVNQPYGQQPVGIYPSLSEVKCT